MINKALFISLILNISIAYSEKSNKVLVSAGQPSIHKASQSTDNQLVLSVGSYDPLIEKLDFSKTNILDKESSKYRIVQFEEGKADSQWLKKRGIQVLAYLPNNAFVIATDNKTIQILDSNSLIRWHGPYSSGFKISPELWQKNIKFQDDYDLMVSIFADFPNKNLPQLFLKFLPEATIKRQLSLNLNEVIINVKKEHITSAIEKLSKINQVRYVEIVKKMRFTNTEAVTPIQANESTGNSNDSYVPTNTPIWDKGLLGTGQIIGIADSGLDSNEDWFVHYDNGTTVTSEITTAQSTNPPQIGTLFPNRKVIGHFVMPGASPYEENNSGHGTHVAGSTSGDRQISIGTGPSGNISSPNSSGYDNDDGMAPNAQILFQDIGGIIVGGDDDGEAGLTGQGSSPMWTQAFNAGARIHTNSYGIPGDGSYSFNDINVDRSLRDMEDLLILFSAGNNDGPVNSTGSPGNAKNVLTVGALGHGNSTFVAGFSNRGPTDDGRIKPDITASGSSIESARGDLLNDNNISAPSRATKSGTSMSTPITAGGAALVRQYYTDGFYPTGVANPADAHIPTGALMKATLINGAGTDVGHFNKDTGWGRVFLANSILFDDSEKQLRIWEVSNKNGLKTNEEMEFKVGVTNNQDLSITLVWYDLPGPFGSSKTLINDLDLSVSVNGNTYKGNVFNGVANSITGGDNDSINTVEQVRIPEPTEGIYTIKVKAANIPGDESFNSFRQGFALVATADFDNINSNPDPLTMVTNLTAETLGDNGIQLAWSGGENSDFFEIYRMEGTCDTADFINARYIGNTESSTYTDFRTLNGVTYAYKIRAGQYQRLGELSSTCVDITSQQACDYLPTFDQSSISVVNNTGDLCHTELQWSAASSNCPANTNIKYNIYRSLDSDFIPSNDNLLTTVTETSFDDIRAPDEAAYYLIRAEDNNSNGTGPNGGNETTGTTRIRSQAVGTGFDNIPLLEDVDTVSIMNLNFPWQVVSNNGADSSTLSYKTGEADNNYPSNTCSEIFTNTISLTADTSNPSISYKAQYDIENNWDGVVVEISTNDGQTWSDFPPNGGYPGNFSETVINNGSYINGCNFPPSQGAFSGTNNGAYSTYSHDLSSFVGQDVKIRWRLSTDGAAEEEGFYLDSIQYPNIQVPNACTVNTAPNKPQPGFYYDPAHNGHGFGIEPVEGTDLYFILFYSYNENGEPEWYSSLNALVNNVYNDNFDNDTLQRSIYDFDIGPGAGTPPFSIDNSIGINKLKIDFNSEVAAATDVCNDGTTRSDDVSLASWQIGDQEGQWCVQPIIASSNHPTPDFGGTWWSGLDDNGWGFSVAFTGDVMVVIMYYFDAEGNPRWAQGIQAGFQVGQEITLELKELTGYPRDESLSDVTEVTAGTATMTLNANAGEDSDGLLNVNITYQGSEGGTWSRTGIPIKLFTEAH